MVDEQTRPRILIVEDSEDDRNMYAHYLSRKGYQVSKARNGKEGLEKALEFRPHIILMDLWLPVMSGWEAMAYLKVDERTMHSAIVAITGHLPVRPFGCDGWLMKPCPLDQLDEEISRILETRKVLHPVTS